MGREVMTNFFLKPGENRRLSYRVLLYILVCSLFFTTISAAYQLFVDYKQKIAGVEQLLVQIEESHLRSLSNSLWDLDKLQLSIQMKGIMALANINHIEVAEIIQGEEKKFLNIEGSESKRSVSHKFPLEHTINEKKKSDHCHSP